MDAIARAYWIGIGVKKDRKESIKWRILAAEKGNYSAQRVLEELPAHELDENEASDQLETGNNPNNVIQFPTVYHKKGTQNQFETLLKQTEFELSSQKQGRNIEDATYFKSKEISEFWYKTEPPPTKVEGFSGLERLRRTVGSFPTEVGGFKPDFWKMKQNTLNSKRHFRSIQEPVRKTALYEVRR